MLIAHRHHQLCVLKRQIHRVLAPCALQRYIEIIRLVIAVIPVFRLLLAILRRCKSLQLK